MTQKEKWIEAAHKGAQFEILIRPKSLLSDWKEIGSILFLCDDIKETFGKLRSNGAKFAQEPKKMPCGHRWR
jgi:predicted enzyme related to lactoylglutathione lyase